MPKACVLCDVFRPMQCAESYPYNLSVSLLPANPVISGQFLTPTVCRHTVRRQCRYHCRGELQRLLPNPNALATVSKGMWAVKLCTNKILQFLTGGAG